MPIVSVIVPAYNEACGIRACLEAVLDSSDPDTEVIVVDDGSTDGTARIVSEVARRERRVRLIRQPRNLGKPCALNAGLHAAQGAWVVVVDADTVVGADFIRRAVAPLASGAADAVAGNVQAVGSGLLGAWQAVEYWSDTHATRLWQDRTGSITTIAGAGGALRKSAVHAVGGYSDATCAEDADLTLRLRSAGFRVAYLPGAVVHTEVPATWRALFHQRVRWTYGNLQCIRQHLRERRHVSGFAIFAYQNVLRVPLGFAFATIPVGIALGWLPVWAGGVYAAWFGAGYALARFFLRDGTGLRLPFGAVASRCALWPLFVAAPYAVAMWKFLTRQRIGWHQALRRGVAAYALRPPPARTHNAAGRRGRAPEEGVAHESKHIQSRHIQ